MAHPPPACSEACVTGGAVLKVETGGAVLKVKCCPRVASRCPWNGCFVAAHPTDRPDLLCSFYNPELLQDVPGSVVRDCYNGPSELGVLGRENLMVDRSRLIFTKVVDPH